MRYLTARRLFNLIVLAVAAHSVIIGAALLTFPTRMLALVGWPYSGEIFWPSQAGLFLIILGLAYGAAIKLREVAWLIIYSKFSAVTFLIVHVMWLGAPRLAALLGATDGLMGLAVAIALRRLNRQNHPTPSPPK